MRRDDYIDFFAVPDHHLAIHTRLEAWSRWVKVRPHGWQIQPMFRNCRSNWRQWHQPILKDPVNIPEALEIERVVSLLPDKHRTALRWCYVTCSDPARMARHLGVSGQGLADLVSEARTMVKNRL